MLINKLATTTKKIFTTTTLTTTMTKLMIMTIEDSHIFPDDDLIAGHSDDDGKGVSDDVGDDDADDVVDACHLIPGHPTLPVRLHLGLAGQRDLALNQLRRHHHYSDSDQDQGDGEYKNEKMRDLDNPESTNVKHGVRVILVLGSAIK